MQMNPKDPSGNVEPAQCTEKSYTHAEEAALAQAASLLGIPPLTLSIWWGDRKGLPQLDLSCSDHRAESLRTQVLNWAMGKKSVTTQNGNFISRYVHINEAATELFFEEAEEYKRMFLKFRGTCDALKKFRSSAIVREAGHAVVYSAFGFQVTEARIFALADYADQWGGETLVDGASWAVDPTTTAEHDFTVAVCLYSGSVCENFFNPEEFRSGANADEVVLSRLIIGVIAFKLGISLDRLVERIFDTTAEILMENADAVGAIAGVLTREGHVTEARLESFLAHITPKRIEICDECRARGKYPFHQ